MALKKQTGGEQGVTAALAPYVAMALTSQRGFLVQLALPTQLQSEPELGQAAETLVTLRKIRKDVEAAKKDAQKPYKEELDKIDADLGALVTRCKEAEATLDRLIREYRIEATRKADEERLRLERERAKAQAEARAKGQNALAVPEVVAPPMPPSAVTTTHGSLGITRTAKWRLVDAAQVPYEYNGQVLWNLNEGVIGRVCREMGVERISKGEVSPIPGVEFYVDETTTVR